jgi:DNA-binding transcriptional regulator YiaG
MTVETATETTRIPNQLEPRTVRQQAELSEEDMANLMGMSANGYRLWENGHRQPGGPAFKLLGLLASDTDATIRRLRNLTA